MIKSSNHYYDLEERTSKYGEAVIDFCRSLKPDHITRPLISQLIRSSTSIGANYMEANNASSKKDFRNKIFIAKKECQESKHWLRMMARALPESQDLLRQLWQESHELTLILQSISKKVSVKQPV